MVTQLVEHERITTTVTKAKALRSLAEKVLALGKRGENQINIRKIESILTTPYTRKKLIFELAPRFKFKHMIKD